MKKPLVSELTLREKIGQTGMVQSPFLMKLDDMEGFLKENPIGGVWHTCNDSMESTNLTEAPIDHPEGSTYYRTWAKKYEKASKYPPFIGLDRPNSIDVPIVASNPVVGAANDEELAYECGKIRAQSVRTVGANWIWGPEVDILSRFCAVGLMRTCSHDVDKLCRLSSQIVKGTQDNGVIATVKHFPGGDREEYRDSHFAPTYIHSTLDEWRENQAKSFKYNFDRGVMSVMIGHCAFPAVDDRKLPGGRYVPATVSSKIVNGLLREELGFDGLAITDAVDMAALKVAFPNSQDMYVEILNAGIDVILNVPDLNYIDLVEEAVNDGRISVETIDKACQRILDAKEKIGLFEEREEFKVTDKFLKDLSAFNKKVAEKAITLECDINNQLPLDASKIKNVAIVCSTHNESIYEDALEHMKKAFEDRGMNVTKVRRILCDAEMEKIDKENDLIIYTSYLMPHQPMGGSAFFGDECTTFFYAFTKGIEKSIGVSLGSVYAYYDFFEGMHMYAHAYSPAAECQKAFVDAIFGDIPFAGTMPYEPAGPIKA